MSKRLGNDDKELLIDYHQKHVEKKPLKSYTNNKEDRDEITISDEDKIKTMREYGCDWGVEDYDYFMSK